MSERPPEYYVNTGRSRGFSQPEEGLGEVGLEKKMAFSLGPKGFSTGRQVSAEGRY